MDKVLIALIEIRNEVEKVNGNRPHVILWLWCIGFMFTSGFYPEMFYAENFFTGVGVLIFTFAFWPMVLGAHVRALMLGA